MNEGQEIFIEFLEGRRSPSLEGIQEEAPRELFSQIITDIYIESALLGTISTFVKEQLWLKEKVDGEVKNFKEFLNVIFSSEIPQVLYLVDLIASQLDSKGVKSLRGIQKQSENIEKESLKKVMTFSGKEKACFLRRSLLRMQELFILEEALQKGRTTSDGHRGPCLYRTFDHLDNIFELDYQLDRDMKVTEVAKERLYEGAGVGVQSGYSTILLALKEMKAKKGARVVDLGSGYGRVGLVCALLRDDLNFIGLEYVPHRVEVSKRATTHLGLQRRLKFEVQDLSLESFSIPVADIYYLYDPFTYETYQYVLGQIVELSKKQKITIVTKGNARSWLEEISKELGWPSPEIIDEGNLCIFRN